MLKYTVLGVIQGLTEFLPVSSSGHLVIAQKVLGIAETGVAVSVALHLGTGLALLIFFFKDILKLLRNMRLLALVVVVTLITGIIGISGKDFFESLFSSIRLTAIQFMINGIILLLTKKFMDARRDNLNMKDAVITGLAQGAAIIPAISRSGITIAALLFRGIDRNTAFRFSFLASIPAIFGAAILEAKDIGSACSLHPVSIILGFIASLLTGILALKILKIVMEKAKLYYFGYYCIIIGVVTLLFIR